MYSNITKLLPFLLIRFIIFVQVHIEMLSKLQVARKDGISKSNMLFRRLTAT